MTRYGREIVTFGSCFQIIRSEGTVKLPPPKSSIIDNFGGKLMSGIVSFALVWAQIAFANTKIFRSDFQ